VRVSGVFLGVFWGVFGCFWMFLGMFLLVFFGFFSGGCGGIRYKVSEAAESFVASWALPITAGGFIYVAMTDVLPDLLKQDATVSGTLMQVSAMGLGVFMMTLVGMLEAA